MIFCYIFFYLPEDWKQEEGTASPLSSNKEMLHLLIGDEEFKINLPNK